MRTDDKETIQETAEILTMKDFSVKELEAILTNIYKLGVAVNE
jgi:hypothetical protein